MTERPQHTPPGVVLGPLDVIPVGRARSYVVGLEVGRFHGFVVRTPGGVRGYVDRCPHMGLPLALELDQYMTNDGASCAAGTVPCSTPTPGAASEGRAPALR